MNPCNPVRYLLVEDNIDHAEIVSDAIVTEQLGEVVCHARNGEMCVEYLRDRYASGEPLPQVILLDLKMPRMNGSDTLRILKSTQEFRHIPVVIMSTSASESEILSCYQLGASAYVSKPVQFSDFALKIAGLTQYWSKVCELPAEKSPGNETDESITD